MMIKIHDIKPIVEIPDLSVYLYYGLVLLFMIVTCTIIYFIYKFFKPKVKTQEMKWYEILENIDFSTPKQAAYDISKYGKYLAKEERQIYLIEELIEELSCYKYKRKTPDTFSQNTKNKLNIFMDTLDVR
jgi:heme/copper-type cytochrome/quinol oxidase subunit 1